MSDETEQSNPSRGYLSWRRLVAWIIPPMSYWVIYHNSHQRIMVVRRRFSPGVERSYCTIGVITLDGPFLDQEDAVRRMAFWKVQYDRDGVFLR